MRSAALILSVLYGFAAGQGSGFTLKNPSAGDTVNVGDTLQIRFEHRSSIHDVITRISFDDGESYHRLARIIYSSGDSIEIQECWDYGECLPGPLRTVSVSDSTVVAGWDWVVPDSISPLPDSGAVGTFSFGDFSSSWFETRVGQIRVLGSSSALRSVAPRSVLIPVSSQRTYDILGRRARSLLTSGVHIVVGPEGRVVAQLYMARNNYREPL